MKIRTITGAGRWITATFILLILHGMCGCIGNFRLARDLMLSRSAVEDGFEGAPDNCTKCHYAWAEKFDYFHGWDRYGYIYGTEKVTGYYDPWYTPAVENTFEAYYATDWWESPELYIWPRSTAKNVESLSVLSRPDGLPDIPMTRGDITGTVITVGENGDYPTIRKAVDKAKPGTTVYVPAGEYNEVIILRDGVNLIGENPATTIINPLNRGHAVTAANNSIIANFTFTGTGIDYSKRKFNCAVYVSECDSTCIIAHNIFRENGLFGVWIDGSPTARQTAPLKNRSATV